MRKNSLLVLMGFMALFCGSFAHAAIPGGYYDSVYGKKGQALMSALSSIVNKATDVGYDGLYDVYKTSDVKPNGKVWDMYSSTSNFSFGQKCGSYSGEGDCYNREHSVPQSWFGSGKPKSDAWLVYPTDGYVNNRRGNLPFGEVGSAKYTSDGGFSKMGSSSVSGYSGTVFEPNDIYKGDFARAYFYAVTRFSPSCGGWGHDVFTSSYPYLTKWTLQMMLNWNAKDPVSDKERNRNDAVYASRQKNRNPFIDYPELVDYVFGDKQNIPFYPGGGDLPWIEAPASGSEINVGTVSVNVENSSVTYDLRIKGKNLESTLTLTLLGTEASHFTLGKNTLTAEEANNGIEVPVTYQSKSVGTHTAKLQISGGGLAAAQEVILKGSAVDDFIALEGTDITNNSFVANWTPKNDATDFILDVWYEDYGSSAPEKVLLNESFLNSQKPAVWQYDSNGYQNPEAGGLRLGSGSKYGLVATPVVDLSQHDATLIVTSKPYGSDDATLYILLDGKEISQVTYSGGSVEKTIPVNEGTSASRISFRAEKGKRVYLENVVLKTGGGYNIVHVDGYPCSVGKVTSSLVSGLTGSNKYYYNVTPVVDGVKGTPSNNISVLISSGAETVFDDDILVYTEADILKIVNAGTGASLQVYTLDGRLLLSRTLYNEVEEVSMNSGIYIVRVTSPVLSRTMKVLINK